MLSTNPSGIIDIKNTPQGLPCMGSSLQQDRMRGIMIQLQTKFSRQVDEHNVLPEYPRPSLVRTSYLNLNGRWECAFSKTPEIPLSFDLSILVPFSPECQLSGVSRQLKPGEYLWYRRTIPLAKPQQDKRILLHFGAADHTAEVFVNRISAVRHCGGYLPFLQISRIISRKATTN